MTLVIPFFFDHSQITTWVVYLAAIFCFYWASYKTWLEALPGESTEFQSFVLKPLENKVVINGGNCHVFETCIFESDISLSNKSDQGITIKDIGFSLKVETDNWLKLVPNQSYSQVGSGRVSHTFVIEPKHSINIQIKNEGKGKLHDAKLLAKVFIKNANIPAIIEYKILDGGETLNESVNVDFDMSPLINRYLESWKKCNVEALNIYNEHS